MNRLVIPSIVAGSGSGGSVVPGSSDVVDIVDTYADLTNYDTSKLKDNDIIKVLSDSTHSDLSSYYRWNKSSSNFTFIGTESNLTFLPFNSNWVTNNTTETFLSNVFSDVNAKPRMAYMGALTCSDLPFNGNAEAVITILPSTVSTKVVHATITSGTDSPYRWECSYYIQNSITHYTGWIGFQPELTAGENIEITEAPTIDNNTKALFHFNDNATNSISDSSISVDTSYVSSYNTGKFGKSARLNIIDGYGDWGWVKFIPSSPSLDIGSQDFHVSFWFKLINIRNTQYGGYFQIFGDNNNVISNITFKRSNDNYVLIIYSNNIPGIPYDQYTVEIATIPASDTNFHLITMERTGNNIYYYIDGILKATRVWTSALDVTDSILTVAGLEMDIDEFFFELGSSKNHNGNDFTPYNIPYSSDNNHQLFINAKDTTYTAGNGINITNNVISVSNNTETITSTTPSLTLADNTFYNCTNALTSLTISSIPVNNVYGIEIHFTTDTGFSGVTFPANTLYTGTIPTWEAGKTYLISIQKNIVVAAEIKVME